MKTRHYNWYNSLLQSTKKNDLTINKHKGKKENIIDVIQQRNHTKTVSLHYAQQDLIVSQAGHYTSFIGITRKRVCQQKG